MKRISILIADDEAEIADLIEIHLEKEGYHVVKAADGEEAIHIIETQPIDLVILDIMMPKMDGYEVTRQIRTKHHMPIIFLSAKTSDFDKVTGLVLGADDYMTKKPIDISELLIQLEEELYPLLEKHHLEARLNVAPHLPMHGDGKLLARVFENLLTNAVRYGYDGQFVDMNGYVDNGEVVVQIMNYGDSIPEEDLPYLFDMFYTGDKARTENRGGTGLGLFIAKNIVEQHNGTISAESNVVRTIFEVRLPKDENVTI
ncbi:hypothetical protein BtSCAC15_26370 [Bacillus thuringiensis]|nr:response regulator [Bacillus thuringiensis]AZR79647.1 hypothetical protein BtSCAC15_26370 [Bacillus thuringiensis]